MTRMRAAVVLHEVLVAVDDDVSELVPRIVEERKSWKFLTILPAGTRYALLVGTLSNASWHY